MRVSLTAEQRLRRTLNATGKRSRDNQRGRLYAAEYAAFGYPPSLLSLTEMEAMVSRVLRSSWFQSRWPEVTTVKVKDGRGRSVTAGGHRDPSLNGGSYITIPLHMRHRWVVCHEVAHTVTPNRFAAHGPEFAANYLDVVRYALGREAKAKLLAEFRKGRVRHRAPVRTLEHLLVQHRGIVETGESLLQSTSSCSTVGA